MGAHKHNHQTRRGSSNAVAAKIIAKLQDDSPSITRKSALPAILYHFDLVSRYEVSGTVVVVSQLLPGVFRVSLHNRSHYASSSDFGDRLFFRPSLFEHLRIGRALKACRRRQRRNERQEKLQAREARLQQLL